jgi:hypothetical protein
MNKRLLLRGGQRSLSGRNWVWPDARIEGGHLRYLPRQRPIGSRPKADSEHLIRSLMCPDVWNRKIGRARGERTLHTGVTTADEDDDSCA